MKRTLLAALLAVSAVACGPTFEPHASVMWKRYDELPDGALRLEGCHRSKVECNTFATGDDICRIEDVKGDECG